MRRLLALLVVAVVGAAVFGLSGASSGLRVDGATVPASTLRSELAVIAATPALQCYLAALGSASFGSGAGGSTLSAAGTAAWTELRVEGLAIERYVARRFHYRPTTYRLSVATSSLEGELTTAATSHQYTCPGTSAQALAAMPAEMRTAQIRAQAASLYLVSRLNSTIPLTTASLQTYYTSHRSSYDTLCVSVAVVSLTKQAAFAADQRAGMSVVDLVHKYSLDGPSKAKGGALGCYPPSATAYSAVRRDVGTTPLNTFPSQPLPFTSNGSTYDLYIAVTSRTVTSFSKAANQVYADVQSLNANSAGVVKQNILYRAAVAVDPAFGRWGLSSSGPSVFAPSAPAGVNVIGDTALSGSSGATYK